MRISASLIAILVVALVEGRLPSQAPQPAAQIAFDAASIKQNKSGGAGSSVNRQPGGRFGAQNATLRELVEYAYQLQPFQLAGLPDWGGVDRWDITAKLETLPAPVPPGTPDDTVLAVRTLLRDRFKLTARRETQQLPIYALVVARPGAPLGPQMKPSPIDCLAIMAARGRGVAPPPGVNAGACGVRGQVGSIQSMGVPLSEFTISLSSRVQRPVVDRTGLTGPWDFTLTYAPEASQIAPGTLGPGVQLPPADPNNPSLFTAIQEQLGLRLDSTRGPVEVLVIEHAERPTED